MVGLLRHECRFIGAAFFPCKSAYREDSFNGDVGGFDAYKGWWFLLLLEF